MSSGAYILPATGRANLSKWNALGGNIWMGDIISAQTAPFGVAEKVLVAQVPFDVGESRPSF